MSVDPTRLAAHAWFDADPDAWVRRVVALHFDPESGAPYWIERAAALDFDPRTEIVGVADLVRLGPMDADQLAERPVLDFVPRAISSGDEPLLFVESSGTTGAPKTAAFTRRDFLGAFVASFAPAAEAVGFPRGVNWLFIGPTGPHAIGRAARELPATMGSPEPFTVDFDPRWARKLPEKSFARSRYLAHLIDQAEAVMRRECVRVLFATPPTLLALAERLPAAARTAVEGIHFGGMEVTVELREELAAAFPGAAFLSGYGNSLFGVALEPGGAPGRPLDHFPSGPRQLIRVVRDGGGLADEVDHGETGRIVMSRLDLSGFYPNLIERDLGTRVAPTAAACALGVRLDGVRDPHPPRREQATLQTGFY